MVASVRGEYFYITYQSTCVIIVELNQRAQIATPLPLLGVKENARVTKAKVNVVTASAPLPLPFGKLNVVPELAAPPPSAGPAISSASMLHWSYIGHGAGVVHATQPLTGMLILQRHLLSQHRRLLLPLQCRLCGGRRYHLWLAAVSAHVRLVAGALHQLTHRAGLRHGVGHSRGCDCVHETRLSGIWKIGIIGYKVFVIEI